jgi:AraC-like DNA-binding protein
LDGAAISLDRKEAIAPLCGDSKGGLVPEASDRQLHTSPFRVSRIRTDEWPERERLAAFREHFGRGAVVVEPLPDEPFRIDATLTKLPGLGIVWGRRSALRSEFADGHHRLMFSLGSHGVAKQFGREIALEAGDAVVLSGSDRGSVTTFRTGRIATLEFPTDALGTLLGNTASCCARRIPKPSPALRLLRSYLHALHANDGMSVAALQPLAVTHLYDLAALVLGTNRDAEQVARGRGVRIARLLAIKTDILATLDSDVSLGAVAVRHAVSPRYVRMLFESEGTSFTEFVREERLKQAHRMLLSQRFDHLRISDIAYRVGFNDLSYFNRVFRRRFGGSPSEVRELGRPREPV